MKGTTHVANPLSPEDFRFDDVISNEKRHVYESVAQVNHREVDDEKVWNGTQMLEMVDHKAN